MIIRKYVQEGFYKEQKIILKHHYLKYLKNIKETGIATGIEKVTVLAELTSETK